MESPFSHKELFKFYSKCALCIIFAMPFFVLGAALCTVIVFIPVGIPLFWIGVKPFIIVQKRRVAKILAWRESSEDREYESKPKPWIV